LYNGVSVRLGKKLWFWPDSSIELLGNDQHISGPDRLTPADEVGGEEVNERGHHRIVWLASLDGLQRSGHDRNG